MNVTRRFKSYFLRGLAVLLPTVVTVWILVYIYLFIRSNISVHISRGLVRLIMLIQGETGVSKEELTKIFVDGIAGSVLGVLMAFLAVCLIGALLASVLGKSLWRLIENFIMNTPFLRRVYPYVKQVTDFVFSQDEQQRMFSRVVAIEYPRKGIWSIALVTGSGLKQVVENVEKECLTVMIPNSPTPITGYVIIVPKEDTIALNLTVEEAFRFTISAGVITPQNQLGALPKPKPKNP